MPRLTRVKNFTQAAQLISRCRKPEEGKSLSSWCKMRRTVDGVAFFVSAHNHNYDTHIGYLTPDNIFTFTLDDNQAYHVSPSLSKGLHKITPFAWYRESTRRYSVRHKVSLKGSDVFDGLKFNFVTGEVLNPQRIDTKNVIPEARRQWLRSVKQYKQGIKLRIKMGVFDNIMQEVIHERGKTNRFEWSQPDWFSDHWLNRLSNALKQQDFSLDILKGITQTAEISYWNRHVTPEEIIITFDKLIKDLSIQLRLRFGVFA